MISELAQIFAVAALAMIAATLKKAVPFALRSFSFSFVGTPTRHRKDRAS
jgi:hypothetical protein